MQCHKCPHADVIGQGDQVEKTWKEMPCAECKLGEDTFYSVPFDEEHRAEVVDRGGDPGPVVSSYSSRSASPKPQTSNRMLPADTIASCIQGLLSLEPTLRDIVAWRYQGLPYKEIALRQNSSVQLAEMRHKRAIRDWPALQALFPEKVAKQSRRRKGRA